MLGVQFRGQKRAPWVMWRSSSFGESIRDDRVAAKELKLFYQNGYIQ